MVDEGFLQIKIRNAEDKIRELENANKTQAMKINAYERRLALLENDVKKFSNVSNLVKSIETQLLSTNREDIKKELTKYKELILTSITKEIEKKLKEKLEQYDIVCTKSMKISIKTMDHLKKANAEISATNVIKHRIALLENLLIQKNVISQREQNIIAQQNKPRTRTKTLI